MGVGPALASLREWLLFHTIRRTNIEIGDDLHLSVSTVKAYLRNMMNKLEARNRVQLIANARAHGLL